MTRRCFYTLAGVLVLALVCSIAPRKADADSGLATPALLGLAGSVVWDGQGQAWQIQSPSQWNRVVEWDVPVPAADVLFIQTRGSGFVGYFADLATVHGEVWGFNSNETPSWTSRGQVPGPVPIDRKSFGAIKGAYR